jgi:hypothetical protein
MAPVAIIVVNLAPGDLLRIEPEFGVALAPLDIATRQQANHRDAETQSEQLRNFAPSIDKNARSLHLCVEHKNKPLQ